MNQDQQIAWLRFWYAPWRDMAPSWKTWLCDTSALRADDWSESLMRSVAPHQLRQRFGIEWNEAPTPDPTLSLWLCSEASQKHRACHLAGEMIQRGSAQAQLTPEDIEWCRHIAKALRPANWMTQSVLSLPSHCLGLWLFKQWVDDGFWQRSQLLFPRQWSLALEPYPNTPLPVNRLKPLWHSIVWRLDSPLIREQ